jgi:hypothetical protein
MRRSLLFGLAAVFLGALPAHATSAKEQAGLFVTNQVPQNAFHGDLTMALVLLAVAGTIFALAAVGVKAIWIMDDAESASHGWPRWFNP